MPSLGRRLCLHGFVAAVVTLSCSNRRSDCTMNLTCAAAGDAGVGGSGGAGGSACKSPCTGSKPVCKAATKTCVECTSNAHCAGLMCNTSNNQCVECLTHDDCKQTPDLLCLDGTCSPCTSNSDCAQITGKAVCKTDTDAGRTLDAGAPAGTCVECVSDEDCPKGSKPLCEDSTNTCVQCFTSDDCTSVLASVCSKHACVGCSTNGDCEKFAGKDVCTAGTCVKATVTDLALGGYHTCARLNDDKVKCWGSNMSGQLGNGQLGNSTTCCVSSPVPVAGVTQVVSVGVGSNHTCAVLSNGTLACWGDGSGYTGAAWGSVHDLTPVVLSSISDAVAVVAAGDSGCGPGTCSGYEGTCILLKGGSVQCLGFGGYGLGNTSGGDGSAPVKVQLGATAVAVEIASGGRHRCARLANSTVQCWGANDLGQLGFDTQAVDSLPGYVTGLAQAIDIAAGLSHSCAAIADGTVQCWGYNGYGQLGNGTTTDSMVPVAVHNLSQVTAVAAGRYHTCAVLSAGTVKCWGYNGYGQLGNGTTTNNPTPVEVSGLPKAAVAIAAGGAHTCARLDDGTVECWGSNGSSQLGDDTTADRPLPVVVSSL
jgi:hypothetical protein